MKWDMVGLKAEYLQGIREGRWRTIQDFYRVALVPRGVPAAGGARTRFMGEAKGWGVEERLEKGTLALAEKTEELATARGRIAEALEKCAQEQVAILNMVEEERRARRQKPQDLKRLAETVSEIRETLVLALADPKSQKGGKSVMGVRLVREDAPFQNAGGRVPGVDLPRLDAPDTGTPGKISGGERREADSQDGPVPEVAVIEDAYKPVPWGGVVHLPVQDAGKTGGVAKDDGTPEPAADTPDTGKDE